MGSDIQVQSYKWNVATLKDITIKIGSGSTPRGGESAYIEERENFAFVRSQNVFDYEFDPDSIKYITDVDAKKLSGVHLKANDILLNITGDGVTFARCCLVPNDILPAAVNQHVCIIRVDPSQCLPGYLLAYLCLPHVKRYIESFNAGGSRRAITKGHIESFEIPLPPMSVQIEIASLLDIITTKNKLNRQINQTLEQMAQALFKSWFVDFDPVIDNALAAGNPIPDELQPRAEQRKALRLKTSGESDSEGSYKPLPESVRALFPDAFEESELGWVPEGWGVALSGEIFDIRDGTHDSPKKSENGFKLVTSKNLTSGELDLSSSYLISAQDYEAINKRSEVNEGDVLLTMIGTIGIPCLISMVNPDFAIKNVGLFRSSQNPEFKYYLCQLLKTDGMQHYLESRAAGTTQKYLSLKVLRSIEILFPERKLLEVFNLRVANFEDKIQKNREQNESLTNLRDTLLPKLISGELQLDQLPDAVASVA